MRRDSSCSSGGKTEDSLGRACVWPPRDDAKAHRTWDRGRRSSSSSSNNPVFPVRELYRAPGHKYGIRDDPVRWAHFQRYLHLLPQHAPPAKNDYIQPRHLWEVESGKAQGPNLRLPEVDVRINITWYRHLAVADHYTLCNIMHRAPVCCIVGKRGRVTLLLKHRDWRVQEANLRGSTISPHISRLEPTAFYALATTVGER